MKTKWHRTHATALTLAVALAATGAHCAAGEENAISLVGARVLAPDGSLKDGLAVVVKAGRIERFARSDEAGLPSPVRLDSRSVVSPGLIDLCSSLGARGRAQESVSPVDPDANAIAAVNPDDATLRAALEAGVTTAVVCPSPRNVVSGAAAAFRTLPRDGALDVLRADAPLVFAHGDSVLSSAREPTSQSGALALLRRTLDAAKAGTGAARVALFLDGRSPALLYASGAHEARGALAVFEDAGALPALVVRFDATLPEYEALGATLASRGGAAIVGPFGFSSSEQGLRAPAVLSRAGALVAFSGGLPVSSRHSPRVTAALATRHGMDAAAARRAITSTAARLAGLADRVGSVEPGRDADLVVFSDDPLRLDAQVLHVWVRGALVWSRKAKEAP